MGFFDDDPFDEIVKEFFGARHPGRQRAGPGEEYADRKRENDQNINVIPVKDKIYLIIDLPGYDKKDLLITANKKTLEIHLKKRSGEGIQPYLRSKLMEEKTITSAIPSSVKEKKFTHSLKNGVLEIIFEKK